MLELAGWAEALRCRRGFCVQGKLLAGDLEPSCREHVSRARGVLL